MSYCVNCGVELDSTASFCPLCRTPVVNPRQPVDTGSPPPFPTERREVPPASKAELAILVSSMLASVAVCCGLLNLVLRSGHIWSLYVIGAAAMLWVWLVPPLLLRTMHLYLRLSADVLAVALYVFLISVDLDGSAWYWHLALPIILLLGAALLFLGFMMGARPRSTLSRITLVIGTTGVFLSGVELLIDRYFLGRWQPGWSRWCSQYALPWSSPSSWCAGYRPCARKCAGAFICDPLPAPPGRASSLLALFFRPTSTFL